jgi:uncharacterized membrane protein (DUF4010 family)
MKRSAPVKRLGRPTIPDPNQVLGIIAIVLSFFAAVIALPLAVSDMHRSRDGGFTNPAARTAVWISGTIIGLVAIGIAVGFTLAVIVPLATNR